MSGESAANQPTERTERVSRTSDVSSDGAVGISSTHEASGGETRLRAESRDSLFLPSLALFGPLANVYCRLTC